MGDIIKKVSANRYPGRIGGGGIRCGFEEYILQEAKAAEKVRNISTRTKVIYGEHEITLL